MDCIQIQERINRIRLEFKAHNMKYSGTPDLGINRIRLEFKVVRPSGTAICVQVLIESDWNLKQMDGRPSWNYIKVLIESDWNLKCTCMDKCYTNAKSINRIRLEFKVVTPSALIITFAY